MARFLLLAVILAASGCRKSVPESRGVPVTDIKVVGSQSKALFTAQFMVEDHYGVKFGDLHQNAKIWWTETKCPKDDSGRNAVLYRGKCYAGLTFSCKEIYVALNSSDRGKLCRTALLHEFGHCMRIEMTPNRDGDAAHADTEFWGVMQEADKVICGRNW